MIFEIVIAGCVVMLISWLFKSGLIWMLLMVLAILLTGGYFYISNL